VLGGAFGLGAALIFVFGGFLAYRGVMDVSVILAFLQYVPMQLYASLQAISASETELRSGLAGMMRVYEILDIEPDVRDAPDAMPLPRQEVDATTPKYLRDKYAIVGVGETTYTRGSGKTTRALGTWALRNAAEDAGIRTSDIDGMLSYSGNDSTSATFIAGDIGARLDFYMDCSGGGSSTEALVGLAIGALEAGMCHTMAIYRSMNGYSEARMGGSPAASRPAASASLSARGIDAVEVLP